MSCTDAYPETIKSQEQMLLYCLILQVVSIVITVFPDSILLCCHSGRSAAKTRNPGVWFIILFLIRSCIWIPDQIRD